MKYFGLAWIRIALFILAFFFLVIIFTFVDKDKEIKVYGSEQDNVADKISLVGISPNPAGSDSLGEFILVSIKELSYEDLANLDNDIIVSVDIDSKYKLPILKDHLREAISMNSDWYIFVRNKSGFYWDSELSTANVYINVEKFNMVNSGGTVKIANNTIAYSKATDNYIYFNEQICNTTEIDFTTMNLSEMLSACSQQVIPKTDTNDNKTDRRNIDDTTENEDTNNSVDEVTPTNTTENLQSNMETYIREQQKLFSELNIPRILPKQVFATTINQQPPLTEGSFMQSKIEIPIYNRPDMFWRLSMLPLQVNLGLSVYLLLKLFGTQ